MTEGRDWPRGSVGDALSRYRCDPREWGLAGRGGASGGHAKARKVSASLQKAERMSDERLGGRACPPPPPTRGAAARGADSFPHAPAWAADAAAAAAPSPHHPAAMPAATGRDRRFATPPTHPRVVPREDTGGRPGPPLPVC